MSAQPSLGAVLALGLSLGSGIGGCATTISDYVPLGQTFAANAMDHPIAVFEGEAEPDRPFVEVAEVFTTKESTHLVKASTDSGLGELKTQARFAGGDALYKLSEKRARHLETQQLILSAIAIRYTD